MAIRFFKNKKLAVFLSVLLLFIFVSLFIAYNVNPILRRISEEKVRALATTAINTAAEKVIVETAAEYSDLIKIEKNSADEIELINVNTLLLNIISRRLATYSQANISELGSLGIDVPIGSLSGLTFLAGRGANIKIKVYPVGSSAIKFDSEFVSAGINQTRHRIILQVTSSVSIIMPGTNKTVSTHTEIALTENIIVGKVPEVYLQSSRLNEMLNLIP